MKKLVCVLSILLFGFIFKQEVSSQSYKIKIDYYYSKKDNKIPERADAYYHGILIAEATVLEKCPKDSCIIVQEMYFDINGNDIYYGKLKFDAKGNLIEEFARNGQKKSSFFTFWPVNISTSQ
jgi:hypothetical protein